MILTLFLSFSDETDPEIVETVTQMLVDGITTHAKTIRPLFSKLAARECKRDIKMTAYSKCLRLQDLKLVEVKKKHRAHVKMLKVANTLREQELRWAFNKAMKKSKETYQQQMAQSVIDIKKDIIDGKFFILFLTLYMININIFLFLGSRGYIYLKKNNK